MGIHFATARRQPKKAFFEHGSSKGEGASSAYFAYTGGIVGLLEKPDPASTLLHRLTTRNCWTFEKSRALRPLLREAAPANHAELLDFCENLG